jgi:CheY-like chemotaxis protein
MTPLREEASVLLVEPDKDDRERYGRWLEDAGYDVVSCPGPRAPDYTCIGGRQGACPLTADVHLIVLDTRLDSELAVEGTSASELLTVYRATGKPILLVAPEGSLGAHEPGVVRLAWPPDRTDLLVAARSLTAPGPMREGYRWP